MNRRPQEGGVIEARAGSASPVDEAQLLDRLATQFAELVRRGQPVAIDQFAADHPALADDIAELFPTILAMERRKLTREAEVTRRLHTQSVAQPERLGNCQLVCEIGRGGMGVVFEARRGSQGEQVAVKWLPWRAALVPHLKERFEQEVRTVAELRHTNIVPLLDYGEDDGHLYYVMRFVDGISLEVIIQRLVEKSTICFEDEIARERAFPAEETQTNSRQARRMIQGRVSAPNPSFDDSHMPDRTADSNTSDSGITSTSARGVRRNSWKLFARIVVQVARALSAAHRQGVLHNDVKPANLLLDANGQVWVTDFGVAHKLDFPHDGEWRTVSGTLRYMAPERFRGFYDELSDLYSLGLTLYELVTRRPAFEASDRRSLIQKIVQSEPVAPRKIERRIPRDLETIILRAIRRDPDERYYSIEAFEADLLRFVNGQSIRARRPTRWRLRWERFRRRWRGV